MPSAVVVCALRMFSSIPAVYPPDAKQHPQVVTNQMHLNIVQCSPGNITLVENYLLEQPGTKAEKHQTRWKQLQFLIKPARPTPVHQRTCAKGKNTSKFSYLLSDQVLLQRREACS